MEEDNYSVDPSDQNSGDNFSTKFIKIESLDDNLEFENFQVQQNNTLLKDETNELDQNDSMMYLQNANDAQQLMIEQSESESSSEDDNESMDFLKSEIKKAVLKIRTPQECKVCGKICKSPWKHMTHMQTHDPEQLYTCPDCGLRYHDRTVMKKHFGHHMASLVKSLKLFKCTVCEATFYSAAKLRTHLNIHQGIRPYTCGLCDMTFTYSGGLRDHLKIHTGEKPHSCDICGKSFQVASKLKNHMRTHTGERPFTCQVCGKGFAESGKLKRHMRTHTGEQPYSCSICGKNFNVSSNLKKHMSIHNGEKSYVCPICNRGFTQNANLKSHLRIHTGEKDPYKCEKCGIRFERIVQVKSHACLGKMNKTVAENFAVQFTDGKNDATLTLQSEELGLSMDKEEIDENSESLAAAAESEMENIMKGKTLISNSGSSGNASDLNTVTTGVVESSKFESENRTGNINDLGKGSTIKVNILGKSGKIDNLKSLTNLLRNNSAYQPLAVFEEFPCDQCDKVFLSLRKKKEHEKKHTDQKPFACLDCGKTFARGHSLEEHMRKHNNDLPFSCKVCGKCFTYETTLKDHMNNHQDRKPFQCDICGRYFSQKGNMKSHKRIHTGDQFPYSCNVCSEKFIRLKDLNSHSCQEEQNLKNLTSKTKLGRPKKDTKRKLSEEEVVMKIGSRRRRQNADLHWNDNSKDEGALPVSLSTSNNKTLDIPENNKTINGLNNDLSIEENSM